VFVCAHNDDVLLDPPIFLDPGLSSATTSATPPATTSATPPATSSEPGAPLSTPVKSKARFQPATPPESATSTSGPPRQSARNGRTVSPLPTTSAVNKSTSHGSIRRKPTTGRKPKPPPLYKNRNALCAGLGISTDDEDAMNDLRAWVETDCIRRGHPLTQPFSNWSDTQMKGLSTAVASRWNRENTGKHKMEWEFIEALIHRICLDNVRNNNARERRRKERRV
jgi:hypothetical protein